MYGHVSSYNRTRKYCQSSKSLPLIIQTNYLTQLSATYLWLHWGNESLHLFYLVALKMLMCVWQWWLVGTLVGRLFSLSCGIQIRNIAKNWNNKNSPFVMVNPTLWVFVDRSTQRNTEFGLFFFSSSSLTKILHK